MIQEEKKKSTPSQGSQDRLLVSLCGKVQTNTHKPIHRHTQQARGAKGAGYPDNKVMLAKCDLISPQNYPGRIASKRFAYTEKNPLFGIFMLIFSGGEEVFVCFVLF